jgi:hypothetical protein
MGEYMEKKLLKIDVFGLCCELAAQRKYLIPHTFVSSVTARSWFLKNKIKIALYSPVRDISPFHAGRTTRNSPVIDSASPRAIKALTDFL